MRRLAYLMIAFFTLVGCADKTAKKVENKQELAGNNRVEVLYFYGKQRCPTCLAIEENTKQVMEAVYKDEMEKGNIVFKLVDMTKSENEELVNKYEVSWSSLFVNVIKDGSEEAKNLTEFAFTYVRNEHEKFKEGVRKEIDDMLKKM